MNEYTTIHKDKMNDIVDRLFTLSEQATTIAQTLDDLYEELSELATTKP